MMNFSVLISVYAKDNPNFFRKALDSIYFDQTLKPNEIIIVVDGPVSDNLKNVIELFVDKTPKSCTKVIWIEQNRGLGYALNLGLQKCKFDIVARMDADDISLSERFEKQINFFNQDPSIDVLGSLLEEFNCEVGDLGKRRIVPETHSEILKFSKLRNPMNHPTVMFKKNSVLESGNYKIDILLWEDYNLWIDMLKSGKKFHNLQTILLYFRVDNLEMIRKRRGLQYALNELKFARRVYRSGFFSTKDFFKYIFLKPMLRLLPTKVLSQFYKFARD